MISDYMILMPEKKQVHTVKDRKTESRELIK